MGHDESMPQTASRQFPAGLPCSKMSKALIKCGSHLRLKQMVKPQSSNMSNDHIDHRLSLFFMCS